MPQGVVTFTFNSNTEYSSGATATIIIKPFPNISYTDLSSTCIGTITILSSNTAGEWTPSNESVATAENGFVTEIAFGSKDLAFTDDTIGFSSELETSLMY